MFYAHHRNDLCRHNCWNEVSHGRGGCGGVVKAGVRWVGISQGPEFGSLPAHISLHNWVDYGHCLVMFPLPNNPNHD